MTNGTSADTREYERMLSGELYIADDPYLKEHSLKRRRLVQEINRSDYDEFDKREALFRELFGSFGEGSYIEPPFRADYGCNTYIGRNFYANTDCIFLDVARIDIGDNAPENYLMMWRREDGWYYNDSRENSWRAASQSPSATTYGSVATSPCARASRSATTW